MHTTILKRGKKKRKEKEGKKKKRKEIFKFLAQLTKTKFFCVGAYDRSPLILSEI